MKKKAITARARQKQQSSAPVQPPTPPQEVEKVYLDKVQNDIGTLTLTAPSGSGALLASPHH